MTVAKEFTALRIDSQFFDEVGLVVQNKLKDKIIQVLIRKIDKMKHKLFDLVR